MCSLWITLNLILSKSSMIDFIVCSELHGKTGYTEIKWLIQSHGWWVTKMGFKPSCTWHWSSPSLLGPLGTTKSNTLARSGLCSSLSSDPDWNSWKWRYQNLREKQYILPRATMLPRPRSTIRYLQDVNGVLWSEDTQVCALQSSWPMKSPTPSGPKAWLTHPSSDHLKAQGQWTLT